MMRLRPVCFVSGATVLSGPVCASPRERVSARSVVRLCECAKPVECEFEAGQVYSCVCVCARFVCATLCVYVYVLCVCDLCE